tara:strand:- start:88 stop:324 length:237 start_codon:yes stop_codon:yes gene_type:complete
MLVLFKKVLFAVTINFTLFLILIIGIQNSSNRSKVKLIIDETIYLPIGFIVGMSFISGSIVGSITSSSIEQKDKIKEQ